MIKITCWWGNIQGSLKQNLILKKKKGYIGEKLDKKTTNHKKLGKRLKKLGLPEKRSSWYLS